MKLNFKKMAKVRSISLMLAVMVLLSGCNVSNYNMESSSEAGSSIQEDGTVSIDKETVDIVGDGTEEEDDTNGTETGSEMETENGDATDTTPGTESEEEVLPELTEEQKLWQDRILANVSSSLNVRKEPNASATLVGKLEQGDYGQIIEKGEEWTKIVSGNVEGYVMNKYCLFGNEALEQAKELAKTYAVITGAGLRVRKEPNTTSKVVAKLSKGDRIEVNEDIAPVDGWIAVIYEEQTCYLNAEYVSVSVELSVGKTMAEIKEEKRLEEEKKKQEAAAKQKAKEEAALAKATDLELLAAIIYCEAGGESYDAQLAVGACVVNRKNHKNYPNTIKGVIYQKNQFSPVRSGKFIKVLMNGKASASCRKAAAAALAGEDNTNGCRSFRLASTGRKGVVYGKIVFF